jgi:hypothetical protein
MTTEKEKQELLKNKEMLELLELLQDQSEWDLYENLDFAEDESAQEEFQKAEEASNEK